MYQNQLYLQLIFKVILFIPPNAFCTVDMNMSEFQYLSNHLQDHECRKLVAALHYKTEEPPNALDQAEKRVSKEVPCLQQLLHWNKDSNAGKSETHELVSRRLSQIGRDDLAKWLSTTTYDALGQDLNRQLRQPFEQYEPIYLREINLTALDNNSELKPHKRVAKQNVQVTTKHTEPIRTAAANSFDDTAVDPTEWTIFDTISWTVVIFLFIIVIILIVYLTLHSPCCSKKKRRNKNRHYDRLDDYDSASSSPQYGSPKSPDTKHYRMEEYTDDFPVGNRAKRPSRYSRRSRMNRDLRELSDNQARLFRPDRTIYNSSQNRSNYDPSEKQNRYEPPARLTYDMFENQNRPSRLDHRTETQNRPLQPIYEKFDNSPTRPNKDGQYEQPERLRKDIKRSSKLHQDSERVSQYQEDDPDESILPTTVPVFPQPTVASLMKTQVSPFATNRLENDQNRAAFDLMGVEMPPRNHPINTIDIHQKIAIPINGFGNI